MPFDTGLTTALPMRKRDLTVRHSRLEVLWLPVPVDRVDEQPFLYHHIVDLPLEIQRLPPAEVLPIGASQFLREDVEDEVEFTKSLPYRKSVPASSRISTGWSPKWSCQALFTIFSIFASSFLFATAASPVEGPC